MEGLVFDIAWHKCLEILSWTAIAIKYGINFVGILKVITQAVFLHGQPESKMAKQGHFRGTYRHYLL